MDFVPLHKGVNMMSHCAAADAKLRRNVNGVKVILQHIQYLFLPLGIALGLRQFRALLDLCV
jgi:hypothetical protein